MNALPSDRVAAAVLPPSAALRLGYLGLVPFASGAALVWAVNAEARPFALLALAAYAALIASFLGGLHWGVGMVQPVHGALPFGWGVVPSLVAWPAVLMPPYSGLVVLGALLAGCYLVDRRLFPRYGLQGWLTLRFRLSSIAALCCFLGAAGA